MNEYRPYLRQVAASSMFNSVTSAVATALLLPLLIRLTGMETYGLWAVLGIFIGMTSLLDCGMWKALVYLCAGNQREASQLLWTAALMCIALASLFALALLALLAANVPVFGGMVTGTPQLRWWLAGSGCLIVLCGLLTNLARGVLEAAFRGHWVNIAYGSQTLLLYAVAVVMARWQQGASSLLLGSAAVYLVILLVHVVLLLRVSALHWRTPSLAAVSSIWRYGVPMFVADLPSIVVGPLLGYLFVLASTEAGDYGSYDLGARIATLAATALSMLSTPFFAIVSGAGANQREQVRSLLTRYLQLMALLGGAGWVLFLLLGPMAVALVFPEHPAEIHRAALIMLSGTAAVAALEPVTRLLMGIGKLRQLACARFIALPVALLAAAVLAGHSIVARFAIAYALAHWAMALGLLWLNSTERWGRSGAEGSESCG
jgi:O-antigen/teichoic acid export membrane protein